MSITWKLIPGISVDKNEQRLQKETTNSAEEIAVRNVKFSISIFAPSVTTNFANKFLLFWSKKSLNLTHSHHFKLVAPQTIRIDIFVELLLVNHHQSHTKIEIHFESTLHDAIRKEEKPAFHQVVRITQQNNILFICHSIDAIFCIELLFLVFSRSPFLRSPPLLWAFFAYLL